MFDVVKALVLINEKNNFSKILNKRFRKACFIINLKLDSCQKSGIEFFSSLESLAF